MPIRLGIARPLIVAVAVLSMAACGGGGGGGGGAMPPPATLSVSPTSLTFLAGGPAAATPAAQTVTGNVTGVTSGTLYITIVGSGPAIAAISAVTITSTTSGQSRRTQVDYVTPYVAYLGTSGNVIIRGQEFSQLTGASAIQNVLFGSTPAVSYTVVSSTEIDATYPATLVVGHYPVVLQSSYTGTHQLANLVVVAPPAFSAAVLAYPDTNSKQPMALVYDAERQALGATIWYGTGATSTLRYAYTGGSWQSPAVMPINNTFTLALAADGADWIAGAYRDVANLGPVSLAVLATPASPIAGGSPEIVFDSAVASDGTVAVTTSFLGGGCTSTLLFYNVRKLSYMLPPYTPCRARVGASADGSRLLVIDQDSSFSGGGVYLADTGAGTLTATGLQALSSFEPVLDRTGDRIALSLDQSITPHWEIFDGNYTDLGSLPTSTLLVILSPDGHKAYTFDQSGLLRTFDLTATPIAGVFPEIGTGITLAGSPGGSVPSGTGIGSNSQPLRMAITPDGATVFIAGTDALIVPPLP